MLLAIDTSTNLASIALVDATGGTRTDGSPASAAGEAAHAGAADNPTPPPPARLLGELTWEVGTRHSVELLERIAWLLASRGATMAQLTALAVATGPGSFNGARVAVATAKSLAFALRLPIVALSTLDVIAWGAGALGPRWALLDAGRGEVYAARYDAPPDAAAVTALAAWEPITFADVDATEAPAGGGNDGGAPVGDEGDTPDTRTRYHLLTPLRLAALIAREAADASAIAGAPPLLCGEWRAATQMALATALATGGIVARYDATPRRAWGLATLALARLATQTNVITDNQQLAALEPLYLRRPAITTSAKRALRS